MNSPRSSSPLASTSASDSTVAVSTCAKSGAPSAAGGESDSRPTARSSARKVALSSDAERVPPASSVHKRLVIEAPWLVNGGHGASLRNHNARRWRRRGR
jgi:hypothetical protein